MKSLKIPYRWLLVILLSGVALLNYLDRQMIATMRPSMQIDIIDLQQATNFGRLMAIFLWVYGSMSAFSGIIADRINRKWLIVGSLFIWSAITLLMGHAQTFDQLYFLRALMGFSEALYIPAGLALIADHHDDKTRSLAIGIHMAGIYVGQAFGGFGSTISEAFSWQYTFIFFGCIGMFYAILLLLLLKNTIPQKAIESSTDKIPFTKLLSSFPFWIIVIYFAVPSLPGWAIKNWAPTLIADNLKIDMALAGPLTTISISLSSLAGVLIGGRLSDKWFQRNIRGRIYTGAIGLSLTIPSLLLMGYGDNLFTMLSAALLFGFGFGMFDSNNMPILCQFIPPSLRATGYGFLNTAGIFSGAIITGYLGKSTDQGNLGKDFSILGIVVLAVIFIQLYFLKPQKEVSNFKSR
jgi:ACS family D-galactonate transporter-like MFS transporter